MSKLLYQNFEVGGGIHNGLPVGSIIPFASDLIIPNGFLICAGQPVSRTMYPDLFQVLGTRYGSGDGETTFNLPNLINGEFLEGSSIAGTSKTPGLPNITGSINSSYIISSAQTNGSLSSGTGTLGYYGSGQASSSWKSGLQFDASNSNSIYGNSITVQPKSLTVIYIIKAFDSLKLDSGVLDLTQLSNDLSLRLQRHQVPAFNKLIKITTSQTYIIPYTGWYRFTLKGGGGGGAGGYYASSYAIGGGSGGEGGTTFVTEYLASETSIAIVIGAGGTAGAKGTSTPATAGGNGGDTTVTINSVVYTGGGGQKGTATAGGLGGTGDIAGASGSLGRLTQNSTNYGFGTTGAGNGSENSGSGGSGGLAIYNNSSSTTAGTAGKAGFVWIEYFDPTL